MKNYTDEQLMEAFEDIMAAEEGGIVEERFNCLNQNSAFEYSWSDVENQFMYEMARRWYNSRQNLPQKEANKCNS